MDYTFLMWIGIGISAWILAAVLIWSIIASGESQERAERARQEAHPTAPTDGGESDEDDDVDSSYTGRQIPPLS